MPNLLEYDEDTEYICPACAGRAYLVKGKKELTCLDCDSILKINNPGVATHSISIKYEKHKPKEQLEFDFTKPESGSIDEAMDEFAQILAAPRKHLTYKELKKLNEEESDE